MKYWITACIIGAICGICCHGQPAIVSIFTCANGKNISGHLFCDNIDNCGDNSDEEILGGAWVYQQFISCNNVRNRAMKSCRLNTSFVCDNTMECQGVTKCDARCSTHYRCLNGTCMDRSEICRGYGCFKCEEDHGFPNGIGFQCRRNGGRCVLPQQLTWDNVPDCDGNIDLCYDIIDSTKLNNTWDLRFDSYATFNQTRCFKCFDNFTIIPRSAICDGTVDCGDLSDECLCSKNKSDVCDKVRIIGIARIKNCPLNQFRCDDGRCLEKTSVCDGVSDCAGSEDESFASCRGTKECSLSTSDDNQCRCSPLSTCENKVGRACDNEADCTPRETISWHGNPEDECSSGCTRELTHNYTCGISSNSTISTPPALPFFCLIKNVMNAIPHNRRCDGVQDCDAGEDELNCKKRFYCPVQGGTLVSIDRKYVCDMYINCDDQSDERNCSNTTRFYCENGNPLFVDIRKIKNGVGECTDYSDECPTQGQFSTDNVFSSSTELISSLILRIFLWIMAILSLVGNTIVIFTEIKMLRKTTMYGSALANHILILNLAAADFLMGVYLFRLAIQSAIFSGKYCISDLSWRSSNTCIALGVLSTLSSEASVLILVLLASFRLYSIIRPTLSYSSPKKLTIFLYLATAWGIALMFALLPLSKGLQNIFIANAKYPNNPFDLARGRTLNDAKEMLFKHITFDGKNGSKYLVCFPAIKQCDQELRKYIALFVDNEIWKIAKEVNNWDDIERIGKSQTNHPEYFDAALYFGYFSQSVCVQKFFSKTQQPAWGYSLFVNVFNFIAFVYVAVAYTVVYFKATKGDFQNRKSKENKKFCKLQNKIMRLVITDFCCWIPICLMAFKQVITGKLSNDAYAVAAIILLPINSVLNPILYSDLFDRITVKTKKILDDHSFLISSLVVTKSKGYNLEVPNGNSSQPNGATNPIRVIESSST